MLSTRFLFTYSFKHLDFLQLQRLQPSLISAPFLLNIFQICNGYGSHVERKMMNHWPKIIMYLPFPCLAQLVRFLNLVSILWSIPLLTRNWLLVNQYMMQRITWKVWHTISRIKSERTSVSSRLTFLLTIAHTRIIFPRYSWNKATTWVLFYVVSVVMIQHLVRCTQITSWFPA